MIDSKTECSPYGSRIKMPERNPNDGRQRMMAASIIGRAMEMDQTVTDEEICWALMITGDIPEPD